MFRKPNGANVLAMAAPHRLHLEALKGRSTKATNGPLAGFPTYILLIVGDSNTFYTTVYAVTRYSTWMVRTRNSRQVTTQHLRFSNLERLLGFPPLAGSGLGI